MSEGSCSRMLSAGCGPHDRRVAVLEHRPLHGQGGVRRGSRGAHEGLGAPHALPGAARLHHHVRLRKGGQGNPASQRPAVVQEQEGKVCQKVGSMVLESWRGGELRPSWPFAVLVARDTAADAAPQLVTRATLAQRSAQHQKNFAFLSLFNFPGNG